MRRALNPLFAGYLQLQPNYSQAITALASAGHELQTSLFEDYLPEERTEAAEARDWFQDMTGAPGHLVTITVHADPILPIPWGLLHASNSIADIDPCSGFWALRHEVAAIYNGMTPRGLLRKARHGVRLLSGIDQALYDKACKQLGQIEQTYIDSFLNRPVGLAFTTSGCRTRWAQVGDDDCLIHFFGHASGTQLRFGEDDVLTASNFRRMFRRTSRVESGSSRSAYILSFLNGCASGSGEDAANFMVATADPGFCGFIGAEGEVPDRFAFLFGLELLHCLMIEGLSVRRAMSHLWRKHQPMALFYGCYAHPDFTIAAETKFPPLPAPFHRRNFHEPLGAVS